jgi:hypothetical protein
MNLKIFYFEGLSIKVSDFSVHLSPFYCDGLVESRQVNGFSDSLGLIHCGLV